MASRAIHPSRGVFGIRVWHHARRCGIFPGLVLRPAPARLLCLHGGLHLGPSAGVRSRNCPRHFSLLGVRSWPGRRIRCWGPGSFLRHLRCSRGLQSRSGRRRNVHGLHSYPQARCPDLLARRPRLHLTSFGVGGPTGICNPTGHRGPDDPLCWLPGVLPGVGSTDRLRRTCLCLSWIGSRSRRQVRNLLWRRVSSLSWCPHLPGPPGPVVRLSAPAG